MLYQLYKKLVEIKKEIEKGNADIDTLIERNKLLVLLKHYSKRKLKKSKKS